MIVGVRGSGEGVGASVVLCEILDANDSEYSNSPKLLSIPRSTRFPLERLLFPATDMRFY